MRRRHLSMVRLSQKLTTQTRRANLASSGGVEGRATIRRQYQRRWRYGRGGTISASAASGWRQHRRASSAKRTSRFESVAAVDEATISEKQNEIASVRRNQQRKTAATRENSQTMAAWHGANKNDGVAASVAIGKAGDEKIKRSGVHKPRAVSKAKERAARRGRSEQHQQHGIGSASENSSGKLRRWAAAKKRQYRSGKISRRIGQVIVDACCSAALALRTYVRARISAFARRTRKRIWRSSAHALLGIAHMVRRDMRNRAQRVINKHRTPRVIVRIARARGRISDLAARAATHRLCAARSVAAGNQQRDAPGAKTGEKRLRE